MTNATNHRTAPPEIGPAIAADGTIAEWARQTMSRAREAGIDPRRVALALGIPLRALDAGDQTTPPDRPTR